MRLSPWRVSAGPPGHPHLRRLGALTVALLTLSAVAASYVDGDSPAVAGRSSATADHTSTHPGNHADHAYVLSAEQEAAALELQLVL